MDDVWWPTRLQSIARDHTNILYTHTYTYTHFWGGGGNKQLPPLLRRQERQNHEVQRRRGRDGLEGGALCYVCLGGHRHPSIRILYIVRETSRCHSHPRSPPNIIPKPATPNPPNNTHPHTQNVGCYTDTVAPCASGKVIFLLISASHLMNAWGHTYIYNDINIIPHTRTHTIDPSIIIQSNHTHTPPPFTLHK